VYTEKDKDVTLRVTEVEEKDGTKVVTVRRVGPNELTPDKKVEVSEKGLFLLEWEGGELDPPKCLLKLPVRAGDKWGVGHPRDPIIGTRTTGPTESVKVPAGKFEAVRVESACKFAGREQRNTFWFSPGIGIVRHDFAGEVVSVLKSFTPGK
jgi:hypothetical protein